MNIRHALTKYGDIEGGNEVVKTLDPFMSMVSRLVGKGDNEGFHGQPISYLDTPRGVKGSSLISKSSDKNTPNGLESYSLFDDQSLRSDSGRLRIEDLGTPEITRAGPNDHSRSFYQKSPRKLTPEDILAGLKEIDPKKLSEENENKVLDDLILNSDPKVFSDCLDKLLQSLRERKSEIGVDQLSPEKNVLSDVEEELGNELEGSTSFLKENSDDYFNEQGPKLKASIIASQALGEIESIGEIKGSEVSLEEGVKKELAEIKSDFTRLAFAAWQSVLMQKSVDHLKAMNEHERSKLIENSMVGNSSLEGKDLIQDNYIRKDQSSHEPEKRKFEVTKDLIRQRGDIDRMTRRAEVINSPRETGLFARVAGNFSPRLGNPERLHDDVSPRIYDEGNLLLRGRTSWPLNDGSKDSFRPRGVSGLNLSIMQQSPRLSSSEGSDKSLLERVFDLLTPRSGRSNSDRSTGSLIQMDSNRSVASNENIAIYGGGFGSNDPSNQRITASEVLSSEFVFQEPPPDESSRSDSPSSTMFADEQGDDSPRAMDDGSHSEKTVNVPELVKKFEGAKDGSHVVNEKFNSLAPFRPVVEADIVFLAGPCGQHPESNAQSADPDSKPEVESMVDLTQVKTTVDQNVITDPRPEDDQVAPTIDNWVYKKLNPADKSDKLYDVDDKHKEKHGYDQDLKLRYSKIEESPQQEIENSIIGAIENLAKDSLKLDEEKLKRFLTYLVIANKIGGIANRQNEFIQEISKFTSQGLDFKEAKKFSSDFQKKMVENSIKTGVVAEDHESSAKIIYEAGFRTKRVPIEIVKRIYNKNLSSSPSSSLDGGIQFFERVRGQISPTR